MKRVAFFTACATLLILALSSSLGGTHASSGSSISHLEEGFAFIEGEWYETSLEGNVTVGTTTETGVELQFEGELSSTWLVEFGPCQTFVEARLWNEGTGTGEVSKFEVFTPCPVSTLAGIPLLGCELEEVQSTGFPWHLETYPGEGENAEIEISNPNFFYRLSAGCEKFGLPLTFGVIGRPTSPPTSAHPITGTFENETGCFKFSESGDLWFGAATEPITLDGKLC